MLDVDTFEMNFKAITMKLSLFFIPFFIFLQTNGCSEDDSVTPDTTINENFIEFLGVRNVAAGGCNEESTSGTESICVYGGGYTNAGLTYAIAVSHQGLCRSATFNLRDNFDESGNSFFIIQVAENGVAIENYFGNTGTVRVTDTGNITSIEFSGTVVSSSTGIEETISGFMECGL